MKILEITEKVYKIHSTNYILYEKELTDLMHFGETEFQDVNGVDEHLNFLSAIQKVDRHKAFMYSIVLFKLFPNEIDVCLTASRLALNINYYDYSIANLEVLSKQMSSNDPRYVNILSLLAKGYRNANQFDKALEYFRRAEEEFKANGDKLNESWQTYSIGKMYLNYLQQPSRSIDLLLQAKKKFESLTDEKRNRGIAACLDELGDVHRQGLRDYKKAEENYRNAIKFNKKNKYLGGLSRNYCHLGINFSLLEKKKRAEYYLEKGIEILKSLPGQQKAIGIRLTQLGIIQIENGNIEIGYENLLQGQKYNTLYNNSEYIIDNCINQGDYFFLKNEVDKAIIKYQDAIEISRNTMFFSLASVSFKKLSDCYARLGLLNESRLALQESVSSNIRHWMNVKSGRPLNSISSRAELGEMYQSLFFKLFDDYEINFTNTLTFQNNLYNSLLLEHKHQRRNLENMLHFANIMSGIKHEVQNLHNNIISVLDDIIEEKTLSDDNLLILGHLRGKLFEKSDVLSSAGFSEIVVSYEATFPITKEIFLQMLNNIISDFRFIEKEIYFDISINPFKCTLSIDQKAIKYIILNILINTIYRFGAKIEISEKKTIRVNSGIIDDYFFVNITDNAGGILPMNLHRVFDFGFTTKKGGTGYGLPSVRALIESSGGEMLLMNSQDGLIIELKFKIYHEDINI